MIIRLLSFVVVPLLTAGLAVALWDVSVERAAVSAIDALDSPDEDVRAAVMDRLAEAAPAALIRSFAHITDDRRGKGMLAHTVQELGRRDSASVVPLLVAALDDDREKLRLHAAMTLAYLGSDALPAVLETLRSSPRVRVRTSAAWILSLMGTDATGAIEGLEAALADENKDVRAIAKYSLHQLRTTNNDLRDAANRLREEPTPSDP